MRSLPLHRMAFAGGRGAIRAGVARWFQAASFASFVVATLLVAVAARAESIAVVMTNGDRVTGELVERTAEAIVIDHPVLGRLSVPLAQVDPATTHPGLLGTSFLEGWDKNLGIGFSGSQGDTDESDLVVSLHLGREDETRRWRIDGRYQMSFSDGDIDDNNANLTTLHDWLLPGSPWFAFTFWLYDFDEFEAWKHRVTFGAGPGRDLYRRGGFTLLSRAGPFFTYEFGDENNARPELSAGLFATWKFRPGHSLEVFDVWLQTVDEAGYRNITSVAWKVRLSVSTPLSLRIGLRNEYDSLSEGSQNNLRYFTQVALDL